VSRPASRFLAWVWGLLLLVLHLDFWRPRRVEVHLGWMPEELVYRVAWMVLALLYLVFFCRFVWTDEGEGA
jgi:hypothetical protein